MKRLKKRKRRKISSGKKKKKNYQTAIIRSSVGRGERERERECILRSFVRAREGFLCQIFERENLVIKLVAGADADLGDERNDLGD